ncbi:MAG: hypothetical protein CL610_01740 [Anaerolineaceae bacterium]|nr:hypothetical protein [Anaerolineaceae bacterium]
MKTWKNFWGSAAITVIWGGYLLGLEMFRYTNFMFWAFTGGLVLAFILTYQVLRVLQYVPDVLEKQETVQRRQQRVDALLNRLGDDELELLRNRLVDDDGRTVESLGDLLEEDWGKRKNR